MSEWKEKRLEELVDINPETLSVKKYKGKIEYIDIASVSMGNLSNYTTYDITVAPSRARRIIKDNDIIFSTVRPNLKSYYFVKCPPKNAICSTGFAVLRVKNGVNSRFIYSLVTENSFIDYLSSVAKGSAYPAVDTKDFKKAKVCIPNLQTQNRIADILSAYDDLIENNNKRIKILEQMAEDLYKEWFVRFRFPGYENAEFENGIPKDWNIKSISEIAEINAGGDAPKEFSLEKTKEYSIPIYSNGIKDDGLYGYSNKATIKDNGITISARGTVGFVCLRDEPYLPIVRLISVHSLEIPLSINWLFLLLKNDIIEGYGTSQQQITVPYFKRKKILVPTEELICNFYEITKPIFSEKKKLKIINTNLIKQRDLLLPRLMSGKLEVK